MVFIRKLTPTETSIILKLQEFVKAAHAESNSHDYAHVLSVCRYAIQIGKAIPEDVDPFILSAGALLHGEALAVVLGVDDDAVLGLVASEDLDLRLGVRVHGDVEDAAVLGEPGVGPAAVVTDADGCDAIDDEFEAAIGGHRFSPR